MSASSTQAIRRADDLQQATTRLSELLEHEVALLRDMRVHDIEALQDDKNSATSTYHKLMHETQRQPEILRQLDDRRRDRLRNLAERLATATSANAIALSVAIRANQRVMQAIADAVRAEQAKEQLYSRDGRLSGGNPRARAPLSISIDQRL